MLVFPQDVLESLPSRNVEGFRKATLVRALLDAAIATTESETKLGPDGNLAPTKGAVLLDRSRLVAVSSRLATAALDARGAQLVTHRAMHNCVSRVDARECLFMYCRIEMR